MANANGTTSPIKAKSIFEEDFSLIPESTIDAAGRGQIHNAAPLLRRMNSINRLSTGLAVILRMVGNNWVAKENHDPEESPEERPLSDFAAGALVNLAEEVCRLIGDDISQTADWVEKHGLTKEGK
jgi:hypothetical protein